MARVFGLEFKRAEDPNRLKTFVEPQYDDGAVVVAGSVYGTYIDLDGTIRNETDLVTKYRNLARQPEIDRAVNQIVNEAVIYESGQKTVQLNLDDVPIDENVKLVVIQEFETILDLLNFNNTGTDIFKRWYVDGRGYYNVMVDEKNLMDGIKELRYIDPRKIRKIREMKKEKDPETNIMLSKEVDEYYIYNEQGLSNPTKFEVQSQQQGVKIQKDSIIHTTSGIVDEKGQLVLSYLHAALKPMNQLRSIEDSTLLYHLCMVGDTRVRTPDGYRYIKDIKPGDLVEVFTVTGIENAPVKKQWSTGMRDVIRVKSKHHEILATSNHPVLVFDKHQNCVHYVDVADLRVGQHSFIFEKPKEKDVLVPIVSGRQKVYKMIDHSVWINKDIPNKIKFIEDMAKTNNVNYCTMYNFLYGAQYAPRNVVEAVVALGGFDDVEFDEKYEGRTQNEVFLPDFVDEDFARLFGFMLGDGSVSKYGLTFAEGTDEEQNKFYASLLETYFGNCRRQSSKKKYSNWTTSNTLGAEIFRGLGFVNGSKKKRIPSWLFHCRDSIKLAFIEGFADADGCIRRSKHTGKWFAEIEIANKALIEDIKAIWTSIGLASGNIRHRIREGGRIISHKPLPTVESWSLFLSTEKLEHIEPILSIESAGTAEVWDIEVDHPKHNFIANDIVVHNSRAPERRAFYIDTGSMPHHRAKQYMEELIQSFRTKLTYNTETGEVKDQSKTMSMLEDFWFQVREGGRGTKVEPISGGSQLSQLLETVQLFEEKLYNALQVPTSRLKPDNLYVTGRSSQISLEEINFAKFIDRIRSRFSMLFVEALEKQLVLKNIVTPDDFDIIRNKIKFKWLDDNLWSQLKDMELFRERSEVMQMMMPFLGRTHSWDWTRRNIWKMSEEEILEEDQKIAQESTMPQFMPQEEEGEGNGS